MVRRSAKGEAESQAEARPLWKIGDEIRQEWAKPYYGAVPYIGALRELTSIGDMYYCDSAKSVVAYFLANAGTWKGEVARRIKAELKEMVK